MLIHASPTAALTELHTKHVRTQQHTHSSWEQTKQHRRNRHHQNTSRRWLSKDQKRPEHIVPCVLSPTDAASRKCPCAVPVYVRVLVGVPKLLCHHSRSVRRDGPPQHHDPKRSDVFAPCRVLQIVGFDDMSESEVQRCARDGSSANPWAKLTTHKHWTREITSVMNRAQCVFSHACIFCLGTASPETRAAVSLVTCNSEQRTFGCNDGSEANRACRVPARKKKTSDLQSPKKTQVWNAHHLQMKIPPRRIGTTFARPGESRHTPVTAAGLKRVPSPRTRADSRHFVRCTMILTYVQKTHAPSAPVMTRATLMSRFVGTLSFVLFSVTALALAKSLVSVRMGAAKPRTQDFFDPPP